MGQHKSNVEQVIVSRGTFNGAFMGHNEACKIIFIFLLTLDVECGIIKMWTGNTTNQLQDIAKKRGDNMNINKNDVLTFLAAVASIIDLMIQWMS